MKSQLALMVLILIASNFLFGQDRKLYKVVEGEITFSSDAPLEFISASSKQIKGLIDPVSKKFAFSIATNSFEGFNNPLQGEHFFENFMEGNKYPISTYSGKIIENVTFKDGLSMTLRTKGILNIHGVKRERIIKSEVRVKENKLYVKSFFTLLLKEHNIEIPKIVYQKIAKEIYVEVDLVFETN